MNEDNKTPCEGCISLPMCLNKIQNGLSTLIHDCSILEDYIFPEYNKKYETSSPSIDIYRYKRLKKFLNYKGGLFS